MSQRPLKDLFDEFILEAQYVSLRRPETIKGYRFCFDTFVKLMPGLSLQLLTPQALTQFFKILQQRNRVVGKGEIRSGIKQSTLASYWNKLSAFFSWLEKKKYIDSNPLSALTCSKPTYEDRKFLSKGDIEKLIAAIHTQTKNTFLLKRDLAIFYLLLFCGLRKEELVYLQVGDIDLAKSILTVRAETSKSKKTRQVPLHAQVIIHLQQYLKERTRFTSPYLIVSSQKDKQFSYDGLKHWVNRLRKASDVRFHLHQLRHTFAVNFLNSSRDLSKLRQLMGHSDIKMTAVYLRNLPVSEIKKDIDHLRISQFI